MTRFFSPPPPPSPISSAIVIKPSRPVPRGVRSALVGDRGLLIADFGGTVWQLRDDGSFGALPDPGPTRPADLAAGGGRLLVATPRGGIPDPMVLTSPDGGDSWQTERL